MGRLNNKHNVGTGSFNVQSTINSKKSSRQSSALDPKAYTLKRSTCLTNKEVESFIGNDAQTKERSSSVSPAHTHNIGMKKERDSGSMSSTDESQIERIKMVKNIPNIPKGALKRRKLKEEKKLVQKVVINKEQDMFERMRKFNAQGVGYQSKLQTLPFFN